VRSSIVVFLATVSLTGFTVHASAAQANARGPLVRGTSFMLLKYASTQTMALYGAYGRGPAMALVGVVWNPRSGSEQLVVGGGTHLRMGTHAGLTVLAGVAGGSKGPTLRLYTLPVSRKGRLTLGGTTTTYIPLGGNGRWQVAVDPLILSFRANRVLGVGLAGIFRAGGDHAVAVGGGPVTMVHVAGITVRGELVALGSGAEARAVVGAAF